MNTIVLFVNLLAIVFLFLSVGWIRTAVRQLNPLLEKYRTHELAQKCAPDVYSRARDPGRRGCLTFIICGIWLIAWVSTQGWRLLP